MPSIASGLNSKAANSHLRKTASINSLSRQTTENMQHGGQMTAGKRKASDMDPDNRRGLPLSQTMSNADGFGLANYDAPLENSPRVKRMRIGSDQINPNRALQLEVKATKRAGKPHSPNDMVWLVD